MFSPPPQASLLSSSEMAGLFQDGGSQDQTHLDVWRGAKDVEDSLGHILRLETLESTGAKG